ncbi:recombinase family protein [Streptomyces sp. NPDC051554]|uniref:recombinase family protein n=1 Tax=Streptomyces sp. NPDC051554 TaxID=3365656 RepID=UPI00378CF3B8
MTITIPTTTIGTLTAREYLRVSVDRTGQERSPEEQHAEHVETADDLGIKLGKPYRDIGSASRYAKKVRDDFERLMDDLRNDKFGADLLWLWESSRGSRKTGEWVTLLDVCEEKGVRFYVQTHERILDPRNGNDRRTLLLDAVDSEHESYKISKRVLRGVKTNLNHEGGARGHGICPFGYERTYARTRDGIGRSVLRPTEQAPKRDEAMAVIELFYRIRAGHSMVSIERDFAARGIVGRRGKPMSAQTLRGIPRRFCYIGKREHKGKILEGSWPCIADFKGASYNDKPVSVEEFIAVFYEVQTILDDPDRRTNHSGGPQHAFSGAMKCGRCGGKLSVTYRKAAGKEQPPAYQCSVKGCVRITKEELDKIVLAEVLAYLARSEVYQAVIPEDGGAELDKVRAQLAATAAQLKAFEDEDPETPAEARLIGRKIEKLSSEITELERREVELTPGPSPLAALFDYGPDVAARWNAKPIEVQRQIAALLLAPDVLGEVRIMQVADSPSDAVADRIKWAVAA